LREQRDVQRSSANRLAPESKPATNHRGDATVTKNIDSQGRACKELRLRNEAGGRRGESNFNACLVDGQWRLVGSAFNP